MAAPQLGALLALLSLVACGAPSVAPEVASTGGRALRGRDRDRVPDHLDRCPFEPEDRDGFEDEDGCPDPDNDRDGVPDERDMCPNIPENYDHPDKTPLTADGCPGTRAFYYCEVERAQVIVDEDHLVDDRSRVALERLARRLLALGVGNHHLFVGLDQDEPEERARLEAIEQVLARSGVQRRHVRIQHLNTSCCEVFEDCRSPLPSPFPRTPARPTVLLLRVETEPCRGR